MIPGCPDTLSQVALVVTADLKYWLGRNSFWVARNTKPSQIGVCSQSEDSGSMEIIFRCLKMLSRVQFGYLFNLKTLAW